MKGWRCYFARSVANYGNSQDRRDIETLRELGLVVVDPNRAEHDEGYKRDGMDHFLNLVESCAMLVFRAHPDGSIPAGVAAEVGKARALGQVVLELPSGFLRRTLTVAETREYLKEVGAR